MSAIKTARPKATKPTRRDPFAHGGDLPAAYRGLTDVLKDLGRPENARLWDFGYLGKADPRLVSTFILLRDAHEIEDAAARLRSAARRVHAAVLGERQTARYMAQLAREAKAAAA